VLSIVVMRTMHGIEGNRMEASSTGAGEGERGGGREGIGRQTFELAHALIASGKRPTEAFAMVAADTGRSAATVATAYYRVARTIPGGAGVKQRARRGARRAPAAPAAATRRRGTTTSELLRQLVDAAAALGQHVERLERENAEYRSIAAALARLR
jgi:hypothetical protein